MASGLPFIIVRGETKEYGTAKRIEGPFERGELVCLLEDVVTSGGALAEAVSALRDEGLVVRNAVCVVDREEGGADALARLGVRLRALFRASELLGDAQNRRKSAWLSQIRRGVRLLRFRELESDVRRRTVTKQEFVDAVADRAGMSKRDAGAAVDAMLDTITARAQEPATPSPSPVSASSRPRRAPRAWASTRARARRCTIAGDDGSRSSPPGAAQDGRQRRITASKRKGRRGR